MSIDTNPIAFIQTKLWDEYCATQQARYGNKVRRNAGPFANKHNKELNELARWCQANNIDPQHYIRTVSGYIWDTQYKVVKATLPKDYNLAYVKQRYLKELNANTGTNPETNWQIQYDHVHNTLRRAPDMYPNAFEVLNVFDAPYEAWFRVAYFDPPDTRLLNTFGELAWQIIAHNTHLRNYLRGKSPNAIKALEERHGNFPS